MTDVILLGEPMGLFTAQEYGELKDISVFSRSLAGAELNVGIGLSRLGCSVEYVTKLGRDPIGEYIFESIEKQSIGRRYISYSQEKQTGLMLKNRVRSGDPKTVYYRSNSAFTTLSEKDVEAIDFAGVELLHITGIPPAVSISTRRAMLKMVEKAKKAGTCITFDPNIRTDLWSSNDEMVRVLNEFASYADVVLPGVKEGELLMGSGDVEEIADFYLSQGSTVVIIKNGPEGAVVKEKNEKAVKVRGFKVDKVVDTVGAGDGFAVGIIYGYLNGYSWAEAAVYANAIGALQVQKKGDNDGLPTIDELTAYVKNSDESFAENL